jgi:pimeloyl-ACP methyl ester carboxylesterase
MIQTAPGTRFLQRDGGRIAYEVEGHGPLVVCAPGMGDIRATFRHLAPELIAAGYRVATFDLRGHGESDTTFASFDDVALASDILALIEHLGGPAVVVGNSMGAGSAVIADVDRPDLIIGLVLVGPFVRNPKMSPVMRAVMNIATAPLWVAPVWKVYLPGLYAGRKPADQAEYATAANAAMRRPGYAAAFSKTTHTTHDPAEAVVGRVSAPALVLMGEKDPDFPSPGDEAAWIAGAIPTETTVVMVPEAGHYPQSQRPDIVVPAVLSFLGTVAPHA